MWFLTDLLRVKKEREEIEALIQEVDWLQDATWVFQKSKLCLESTIQVQGKIFPICMKYPDFFPSCPPTVIPRGENQIWSSHQYGVGGELCLEWGPDNWCE